MSIQRHAILTWAGVAIIAIVIAFIAVLSRAPRSDLQGNAPSAVTAAPCDNVPDNEKQRCREAYDKGAAQSSGSTAAREQSAGSANSAAATRGSGVEGVTSGGTTSAAGSNR